MTRATTVACAVLCLSTITACTVEQRAPHGGEAERQLAAATMAADVGKVSQLLASGANPNQVVDVNGDTQSPWFLALYQLRPRRPETIAIVTLMLKSGANPHEVWGTSRDSSTKRESAWSRFWSTGARQVGFGSDAPMRLVLFHPVPELIVALIDAGVDANIQVAGVTPLLVAIDARDVALMTYLEAHGAREKP